MFAFAEPFEFPLALSEIVPVDRSKSEFGDLIYNIAYLHQDGLHIIALEFIHN